MLKKFFNILPHNSFFVEKEEVKKIFLFFSLPPILFFLIIGKFGWFSYLMIIVYLISSSGLYLFQYYSNEIDKKYNIKNTTNLNNYSYQTLSLCIFSFITTSLALFIMLTLLSNISLYNCILISLIFSLPFFGIGVRFKTFHDDSRWIKGKDRKEKQEIGYNPMYYFYLSCIICFIGYYQIFYLTHLEDIIILIILTFICHVLTISPDKMNKYLPFDNRTLKGNILYLGAILILFMLIFTQIIPLEDFWFIR
ncbi:MAG: hypothetical protein KO202_07030 [Methanobacteriaceae archaeon]|jgi:hypothetical protein|nr:hypothetical protein [Methanobacteriaceae archaeon]